MNDIPTFRYDGPDGTIQTWQHAFNLQDLAPAADGVIILYHYTNELGFQNVGNMRLGSKQVLESRVDLRPTLCRPCPRHPTFKTMRLLPP